MIINNKEVLHMPELEQDQKVQEEKVEVKVSEDEQKKLEESLDTVALNEPETLDSFNEKLEANRADFYKLYNRQRRLSNILMPVAGLLMAGSLVLFIAIQQQWGKILGGCLIGATLVGMIIYFILTRNKLPNKSKEYIRSFVLLSDNYVFDINEAQNAKVYLKKRYAIAEFLPDRVYKDIVDIASRNIVSFEYKNHNISVGELALYKAGAKKHQRALLFVGKYMSFVNDYHFEDRYIINISGDKKVDAPNDIEDLVVLKEQNHFAIYGKDGAKPEKDLGKDVIKDLNDLNVGGSLLNVNVVLWAGHTAVYLSYDDGIVAIPLDKQLNTDAYKTLKKNIKEILEIFIK